MGECRPWINSVLILIQLFICTPMRNVEASGEAEALLTEFMVSGVNSTAGLRRSGNLRTIESLSESTHKLDKRSIPDTEVAIPFSRTSTLSGTRNLIISKRSANAEITGSDEAQRRAIIDLSIETDEDEPSTSLADIRADLKTVEHVLENKFDGYDKSEGFASALAKAAPRQSPASIALNDEEDYIPHRGPFQEAELTPAHSKEGANDITVHGSSHIGSEISLNWDKDDEMAQIFSSVMHHLHEAESKLKNLSSEADVAEKAQSKSMISGKTNSNTSTEGPPFFESSLTHQKDSTNHRLAPRRKSWRTGQAEIANIGDSLETQLRDQSTVKRRKPPTMTLGSEQPSIKTFNDIRKNKSISSSESQQNAALSLNNFNSELSNVEQSASNSSLLGPRSERIDMRDEWASLELLQSLEENDAESEMAREFVGLETPLYQSKIAELGNVLVPYREIPIASQLARENFDGDILTSHDINRLRALRGSQQPEQRSRLGPKGLSRAQDLMLSKYYQAKEASMLAQNNAERLSASFKIDLEDPQDDSELLMSVKGKSEISSEAFADDSLGASVPSALVEINPVLKTSFQKTTIPVYRPPDVSPLIKLFFNVSGNNLTEISEISRRSKTNDNKIEFYSLKNSSSEVTCMDGSKPGYFMRKGIEDGVLKWIVHLHGGAWCYDLRSCQKRRNTILGSTKNWFKEDIDSFFHGVLSRNYSTNHHFFNWNIVVLSYCDGGLFSGTRRKALLGKGSKYYFRGQLILQNQIERLKEIGLSKATDIILSGTSAGGLSVILQGDFIRSKLPAHAKVRGLVDAGLFMDEESKSGKRLARKQMKALYKLHKPKLNDNCAVGYPPKQRYLCLFPEYTIKYVRLPIFFVNSLYDHWQLSELQGVHCVYKDKCDREDKDRILKFRKSMFEHLMRIVKQKNDSGVFANSCLAHGQVILDYTWSRVRIANRTIENAFNDWYNQRLYGLSHVRTDCRYPCNGSCPRILSQQCVINFKGASEHIRGKRNSELC